MNVDSTITLQVPEGTPEEQRRVLNQDARLVVREEINTVLNNALMANPRNEQ